MTQAPQSEEAKLLVPATGCLRLGEIIRITPDNAFIVSGGARRLRALAIVCR